MRPHYLGVSRLQWWPVTAVGIGRSLGMRKKRLVCTGTTLCGVLSVLVTAPLAVPTLGPELGRCAALARFALLPTYLLNEVTSLLCSEFIQCGGGDVRRLLLNPRNLTRPSSLPQLYLVGNLGVRLCLRCRPLRLRHLHGVVIVGWLVSPMCARRWCANLHQK